jgi:hypothetical protein
MSRKKFLAALLTGNWFRTRLSNIRTFLPKRHFFQLEIVQTIKMELINERLVIGIMTDGGIYLCPKTIEAIIGNRLKLIRLFYTPILFPLQSQKPAACAYFFFDFYLSNLLTSLFELVKSLSTIV